MKPEKMVIVLSIVIGLFVCFIDGCLDYFIFYEGTFWGLLISDVPPHEIYTRTIILLAFAAFGVTVSGIVSRRKHADKKLKEGDERFRSLFENAPLGCQSLDANGDFIEVNETWCKLLGYTKEEVLGRNFSEFIHPDFREVFKENFPKFKSMGYILGIEFEMIRKDGSEIVVAFDGEIGYNRDGSFRKTHCVLSDVTERKRAEEEVEHLARFPSENPFPVLRIGEDGTVLYANVAAGPLLGALGPAPDEEAPTQWKETTNEALRSRSNREIDVEHNGRVISFVVVPVVEAGYVNWYGRDVTERKRAEDELRLQSEIAANASEGVNVCRMSDGVLVYTNSRFEEMFGYAPGELVGKHASVLNDPAERSPEETTRQIINDLDKDGLWQGEVHNIKKNGEPFWCYASISTFDHREYGGVLVTVQLDINERKRAEKALQASHDQLRNAIDELKRTQEQVIRQERLRAVGEMASGIGHDLNNTLTPILGYSEMLRQEPTLSETARDYVKWIEMGARDAATVVARVRQFHQAEHTIEGHIPVQVGELLTDVAELTRPQWRDAAQRTARDIELDLQLEDVPPVLGHPAELREVFTNLILNAVDALPKGGRITLRLRGTSEAVVVEVVDTGIGMPADVRLKCFEPFFSTKGSDGTGLGLSMCHGIVERHGGRIEIDSTPGHGTTFGIHLPVAAECASDEPHPSEAPLPNGRVLYIDDDPRVRMVVGAMLNQLGQQVDMAESGAEGLEMFHANEYDVVVTDLGMPNVDGSMVTSIVKTARPEQPVVMLTGWGAGPENQLPSEAPDFVLSKPVTIRQLQEVLERVLRIP